MTVSLHSFNRSVEVIHNYVDKSPGGLFKITANHRLSMP